MSSRRPAVAATLASIVVATACGGAGEQLSAKTERSVAAGSLGPVPDESPPTAPIQLPVAQPPDSPMADSGEPASGAPVPPAASPSRMAATDGIALPTYGDGPVPRMLLRGVRLVGSAERRCVWLLDMDGRKHAALWPPGYRARFDPVRVFNAAGRPVWGEGHEQDIGGGFTTVGVERLAPECRVDNRVWWVSQIDASDEPMGSPAPRHSPSPSPSTLLPLAP